MSLREKLWLLFVALDFIMTAVFCVCVVLNSAEKTALNRMQSITFCVISWE